jgi:hypothetical protein
MDLKQYYLEMRAKAVELAAKHPDGIVHVTSVFYRERNSTPGSTASATCYNAARVLTDGTHREATEGEIEAFYQHQQDELEKHTRAEQQKKKQFLVVTDTAVSPMPSATIPRGGRVPVNVSPAPAAHAPAKE